LKTKKTAKGYRFDWYQDGKRCRKVFRAPTLRLAKDLFEAHLRQVQLPSNHRIIRDAVADYLMVKTPSKRISSQCIDKRALSLLSEVCGAHHQVEQITEKVIALLIKHCREELRWQVSTINRFLNTVRNFLNWCHSQSWHSKPFRIQSLRGYSRESRPLTSDELRKIWQYSGKALRLQVLVSMMWGLRRAEVSHLAWNAIDFESGRVKIGGINGFQTKSGESRTVYLTDTIKEFLLSWRTNQKCDSKWVFASEDPHKPVLASNISKQWARMRKRAGLTDVRFHDLRATAATQFADTGHGDAAIASLLGHRTVSMARKYSNRVHEDHRRKAFQLNDDSLSKGLFSVSPIASTNPFSGHDSDTFDQPQPTALA
jgi:integrase